MPLPHPPERVHNKGEMIILGNDMDHLRFVAVAKFTNGSFKPTDYGLVTTFEQQGSAALVRLMHPVRERHPKFIFPEGNALAVDAVVIRDRVQDSPPSITIVSWEIYDEGRDQRFTKITIIQGDPELHISEIDPNKPEDVSEGDQRILDLITAEDFTKRRL